MQDSSTLKAIVYISGAGRSGSTILDRTLGAIEGVASFNEMHVILQPWYTKQQVCSCGQTKYACSFWQAVFEELSAMHDIDRMTELAQKYDRSAIMPRLMTGFMSRDMRRELDAYAAFTADKCQLLAKHTDADVIVDSSKVPSRPLLLHKYAGLKVYVVHLVRHPGAVADSWRRKKTDPSFNDGVMTQFSVRHSIGVWALRQLASEALRPFVPYRRIRYEDFTASPRETVENIMDFVPELRGRNSGFVSSNEVDLPILHSLSGNPDRFRSGPTVIREDEKWKTSDIGREMGWQKHLIAPLAARYRYKLKPET